MGVTERPVIRQWCKRCLKVTETWCDSGAFSRCRECDPPGRDPRLVPVLLRGRVTYPVAPSAGLWA